MQKMTRAAEGGEFQARLFASPSVQSAQLEVMVEARDPAHAAEIEEALSNSYTVHRV